jgi:putative drug exporter of the RND superfamily
MRGALRHTAPARFSQDVSVASFWQLLTPRHFGGGHVTTVREKEPVSQEPPTRRASPWRWLVPALLILAWLLAGGSLGPLSGKTNEVQKNDNSAFLPQSAESTKVQELIPRFTETQSATGIVVYVRPGGLTDADKTKIQGDQAAIASHFDGQLAGPPLGPVWSKDGKAAEIIVQFSASDPTRLGDGVQWIRDRAGTAPGLETHVAGPAGLYADFGNSFKGIDGVLLLVTGIIVLVILILVYRSPILPFVVLGSAVFALTIANGAVYLLAKHDVITLNGQSQGILDVLVLGAGTDYALLLVSRYREELRRYASRFDAMKVAWRAAVAPIVASGGTVIVALMCLLLSDLKSNKGLGPVGSIGIAAALLAMLTLLPAILVLLGRVAFWPFRPKYGSRPAEERGLWSRISRVVGRRYRWVWVLTTLVLLALAAGIVKLNPNGVPLDKSFTTTQDSVVGQRVLGEHFDAGTGTPTVIIANAEKLGDVIAAAGQVSGVATPIAPYTGAPPGVPAPPKVVGGLGRVDVTLSVAPDTPAGHDVIRALRAKVHAVPGADAKVGGFSAINLDVQDTAKRDRNVIIPIVLFVVFVILVLLLRAVLAPLVLILTVVLSFVATLGASGLVFREVFGFVGTDSAFPLFAFVFLVALGVDYNIFLMTRVREETAKRGHRAGTLTGLAVTGGVITSAGLVLAATFASLSVLPLVFLAELAFTVAFGVLLDTLVVRTLLVPALTVDIGRISWWPSKLSRGEP